METIKNYLESMFKALPKTAEILKLKNELLSNMEEKYLELKSEGKTENEAIGIVISEFGNIDELLKEMEIDIPDVDESLPEITLEEADKFITLKKETSIWIGMGVVLCILGAAALILLTQLINDGLIFQSLAGSMKDFLPVTFLLIIIVPAVAMFIYSGTKLEKYKYIDDGAFYLSTITKSILRERHEGLSSTIRTAIITGVCLCILSPIAIFTGDALSKSGSVYGVCVLLVIVAGAVFLFIRSGSIDEAYKKLIKTGEYTPEKKKEGKVIGAVAGVVWPIATCIFLLWGFLYGRWDINWIVFPITGILFGAFASAYSAVEGGSKKTVDK